MNRINHIRGQSGKGKRFLSDPGERRRAISEALGHFPVNRWVCFSEAVRFVEAAGGAWNVTREPGSLYFSEWQYGALYEQHRPVNHQYLRAFFFETLATLGVIDIAYGYPHRLWPELSDSWGIDELSYCSRYDGLLYVRLNPLGAYCLNAAAEYQPPAQARSVSLCVLPNREVAVLETAHFGDADRRLLENFASPKSEYVWELDPARILDHLEAGGETSELSGFLEDASGAPLPETVARFLADLDAGRGAVTSVEEALLVAMRDEEAAARVAHDTQAGKYCRAAGGSLLAVPRKNARAFRSALKKLGYIVSNGQFPA